MIENYMGFPQGINGADLAERARQQAVKFGVELLMMQEGVKSTFHDDRIWTDLADGGTMVARTNVCATGVEWRRLNLPSEDELLGRGLYYGAGASEAPLCGGEDVYVVGGGNSAGQAVMHLAKYARSVTARQGARRLDVSVPVRKDSRSHQCAGATRRGDHRPAGRAAP